MKMNITKFYLFGTLGLSTEIVFTAFLKLYHMLLGNLLFNLKLEGHSYIWMFFIYGLAAILFPPVFKYISRFWLPFRLLIIATGIFLVEFITGWILDIATGQCPWQYTNKWNVCGYIRLDYLPVWILFGFILEKANNLFNKMTERL